jgi:enoyl-[acyl-carrier protein] reductase II
VFTSAGNPETFTQQLKDAGIIVVHVIANTKFALKAQNAGVDALVAEGFEAGGHNGKEETTTFCLLPQIKQVANVPIIAAGGMYNANSLVAALALGADGIQIGSRFAVCKESSAHDLFKQAVYNSGEGDTALTLKEITPVRILKNDFYNRIMQAYQKGADKEALKLLLGKGRAKLGIFEGNLQEGELEIGQISSLLNKPEHAHEIIDEIMNEYPLVIEKLLEHQHT